MVLRFSLSVLSLIEHNVLALSEPFRYDSFLKTVHRFRKEIVR